MQGKAVYIMKCGALWEQLLHLLYNGCSFKKTNVSELGVYRGKMFLLISLSLSLSVSLSPFPLGTFCTTDRQSEMGRLFSEIRDKEMKSGTHLGGNIGRMNESTVGKIGCDGFHISWNWRRDRLSCAWLCNSPASVSCWSLIH